MGGSGGGGGGVDGGGSLEALIKANMSAAGSVVVRKDRNGSSAIATEVESLAARNRSAVDQIRHTLAASRAATQPEVRIPRESLGIEPQAANSHSSLV